MKKTILLILLASASLVACGKTEEATTTPMPEPVQAVEQATPAPVESAIVDTAPAVVPPAVAPVVKTEAPKPALNTAAPKAPAVMAPPSPVASTPQPDLSHGQQIYQKSCAFCHDKGVAGAPKIGDVDAWRPRLAQGVDAMYITALRGKGAMPAKGGNPSLADADVKAAVDYLVAQSR